MYFHERRGAASLQHPHLSSPFVLTLPGGLLITPIDDEVREWSRVGPGLVLGRGRFGALRPASELVA